MATLLFFLQEMVVYTMDKKGYVFKTGGISLLFLLGLNILCVCAKPSVRIGDLGIKIRTLGKDSKIADKYEHEYRSDPISQEFGKDVFVLTEIKVGDVACYEIAPNDLRQFYELPASLRPTQAIIVSKWGDGKLSRLNLLPLPVAHTTLKAVSPSPALDNFNEFIRLLSRKYQLTPTKVSALAAVLLCHNDISEYPDKMQNVSVKALPRKEDRRSNRWEVRFSASDHFRGVVHYELSISKDMEITAISVTT
jgi:hypothetical protein